MSYRVDTPQEWNLSRLVDQIKNLERGLAASERQGNPRMNKLLKGRYNELLRELNRRSRG